MTGRRQSARLVPPLLRALPRTQLAAGTAAAFAVAGLLAAEPDSPRTILALQGAALVLSLACASILDDPTAETVAALPPTLRLRRILTIALTLPAVAIAWAAILALSGVAAGVASAMTLQLGALVLLTLALAASLAPGAAVAGPLVVLLFLGVRAVAPEWALAPQLGDWRWDTAWTALAASAVLALLLVSRDPAHRARSRTGADPPT